MREFLISIIVPMFNVEKYIVECLDSIYLQNVNRDLFEVILINDGSTDDTLNIAEEYVRNIQNATIITQKNSGLSAARNKGLEVSKGKYIYFFDSDDLISDNFLEKIFGELKSNNLDIVFFSGEPFYDKDYSPTKYTHFEYNRKEKYPNFLDGEKTFIELINNGDYYSSVCLFVVKKEILLKNGIKFVEGLKHEDELFTLLIIKSSNRNTIINDVLFLRRVRANSIMTTNGYVKSFESFKYIYNYVYSLIQENHDYNNLNLLEALEKKLGHLYGNIINNYAYFSKVEKIDKKSDVREINHIAKEFSFFNRKAYWLFHYFPAIYIFIRKIYNSYKVKGMKQIERK